MIISGVQPVCTWLERMLRRLPALWCAWVPGMLGGKEKESCIGLISSPGLAGLIISGAVNMGLRGFMESPHRWTPALGSVETWICKAAFE